MSSPHARISFSEFFQRAHLRGLNLQHAAQRLLTELKDEDSGFVAWGLLKIFTLDDNVEVLPRRLFPEAIPITFWQEFEEIGDNCVSSWCDNPEKTMCFRSIDWVVGAGEIVDFEFDPYLTYYWHEWSGLEVSKTMADNLLKRIGQSPDHSAKDACDKLINSDAIRHAFIREYPGNSPDEAHRVWTEHSAFDGTKRREFRKDWKLVKGEKGPGRPAKSAAR